MPEPLRDFRRRKPPIGFRDETGDRWYWVDGGGFDSKLAFSVIQMLMTLAETPQTSNAVVTVPAR